MQKEQLIKELEHINRNIKIFNERKKDVESKLKEIKETECMYYWRDHSYSLCVDSMESYYKGKSPFFYEGSCRSSLNPTKFKIIKRDLKIESFNSVGDHKWLDTLIESTKTGIRYFTQERFLEKV